MSDFRSDMGLDFWLMSEFREGAASLAKANGEEAPVLRDRSTGASSLSLVARPHIATFTVYPRGQTFDPPHGIAGRVQASRQNKLMIFVGRIA